MIGEARQFAIVIDRIGRGVLEQLNDLPDETLNREVPLPEANKQMLM